jgi:hypothetical protein
MADPDRGFGEKQTGSWAYSCLPFLEEQAVHQIGARITNFSQKTATLAALSSMPVTGFYCPTRRPPITTPRLYTGNQGLNANHADVQARSDYAANLGSLYLDDIVSTQWFGGPPSFARAEQGIGFIKDQTYVGANGETMNWMTKINGIVFQAFQYSFKDITDGTAKTFMVGEKYLMPESYSLSPGERPNLKNYGDDQSCWAGDDLDMNRNADNKLPPAPDQPGLELWYSFGSAHPGGFLMSMCDASVRIIGYDIAPTIYEQLGDRRDGEPVPGY